MLRPQLLLQQNKNSKIDTKKRMPIGILFFCIISTAELLLYRNFVDTALVTTTFVGS